MTDSDQFERWARHALRHLYDPISLESSPLVRVCGLSEAPSPASSLRRLIIQEIRALEPLADTPDSSPLWSMYEVLVLRYVQQCAQLEVADQLGLSDRHLRRREQQAIANLSRRLQETYGGVSKGERTEATPSPQGTATDLCAPNSELAWLREAESGGTVSFAEALASALEVVRPLALAHGTRLTIQSPPDLPPIAVHPVGLHQTVVSLLSATIRWTGGGKVSLAATAEAEHVVVALRARTEGTEDSRDTEFAKSLDMVRQLVEACGGCFGARTDNGEQEILATLPAVETIPLLVIDDNQDLLELLRRYASGTPYRIHGLSSVEQVLDVARRVRPRAIMLDVMMPGMAGWEVLGRLRNHPLTRDVPVIICTILPETELALSLGASGLVQKPFSRAEFLACLDQQLGPAEPMPD